MLRLARQSTGVNALLLGADHAQTLASSRLLPRSRGGTTITESVPRAGRDVTVVAVTYNATAVLPAFLSSVRRGLEGLASSIVVVDNGSLDGTQALVAAHSGVTLLAQSNTGYAHAVNRGIEWAPTSHDILVLNPDLIVDDGAITRLQARLVSDPSIGIAVPAMTDQHGRMTLSLRRAPSPGRTLVEAAVGGNRAGRFGERFAPIGREPVSCDWATGAALLIRREALEQVGAWSEAFFMYSEETDFCLRVGDLGWRVVCDPAARVMHAGGEMATDPTLWSLRAINQVRFARRRGGRLHGAAARAATILFELRRAITGSTVSRPALRRLLQPDLDRAAWELVERLGGDPTPMRTA